MQKMLIYGAFVAALLVASYAAGRVAGALKCEQRTATNAVVAQTNTTTKKREVNEQANTSATGDIRRWLHDHYTIAD